MYCYKMNKIIASSIILCIQCTYILAQSPFRRRPLEDITPVKPTRLDPVSKILSDLSDFILDVDEEIGRRIAPKTNLDVIEPIGKPSPRTTYLEKIRENYKDLQERIESPLRVPDDFSLSSDLLDINVKNKGRDIDVSLPLRPIKIVARTNNPFLKNTFNTKDMLKVINEDDTSEEQNYPSDTLNVEPGKIQRRSSGEELKDVSYKEVSESEKSEASEQAESDDNESEDSGVGGRILGDVLYSESTFDKIMKRLISDHGSWTLDSELSPSKVFDRLNRVTQRVFGRTEDKIPDEESLSKTTVPNDKSQTSEGMHNDELHRDGIRRPIKIPTQNFNAIANKRKNALHSEFAHLQPRQQSSERKTNVAKQNENLLLAFTPDGVPLKLKVARESGNPFKYLHKVLLKSGVILNFPVKSYQDIEPAGTEILQLGAGKGGMNARALNIDLTDSDQLDALIRVLQLKPVS